MDGSERLRAILDGVPLGNRRERIFAVLDALAAEELAFHLAHRQHMNELRKLVIVTEGEGDE